MDNVTRVFCIAKGGSACWHWRTYVCVLVGLLALVVTTGASAQSPGPATPLPTASAPVAPSRAASATWVAVPRDSGRLSAKDIGLVINTADPYSVAVGEYYAAKRGLQAEQVLRLEMPTRTTLTRAEFELLEAAIARHFGATTQALALAWVAPSAVSCNAITGALALGVDEALCKQSCSPSRPSPYANTGSARPYADFGVRPSMLLAAGSVAQARALIDRGVASDHALTMRGAAPALALFIETTDAARNVRAVLYPPEASTRRPSVNARRLQDTTMPPQSQVVLVQTGTARVRWLTDIGWAPGGLGDHLTSYGGRLDGKHDHTTVIDWIDAGATASHGIVSEPCNHLQKFPHPQWLLLHYMQGSTAIEAYWKSVRWPQQSLFVGEPLAAPFAPR